jgi:hypothetical protein
MVYHMCECFSASQEAFTKSPIMAPFDADRPTRVETNTSDLRWVPSLCNYAMMVYGTLLPSTAEGSSQQR